MANASAELHLRVSSYPECAQELIEFRNLNRNETRDRAYFDWRYLGRPCAVPPTVVWAEKAGRHIGALTLFPHDYFVLDGEYPLGVLGDISVRPECRGLGVANAMFRFLGETQAVRSLYGCLVLPNADAARPLHKAGWCDANRIERFAKVLNFHSVFERFVGAGLAGPLAVALDLLARQLSYETLYRAGRYRADPAVRLDGRFDELWARADKRGKLIGVRNARYLRWRFQNHPLQPYQTLAVTDGETLCGYAMYRIVGDLCYVDDLFCIDPVRHTIYVVGLLLAHLREKESVSTVSVSINRGALDFPWRRFGFLRRADYNRVMIFDGSSANGRLKAINRAAWHITAGDKDV